MDIDKIQSFGYTCRTRIKVNQEANLNLLKKEFGKASLAVQKANDAVRMYEKVGFKTVDENDEEYIMVCEL